MDKSYEIKYHKIEEEYWWFVARRDMILQLIRSLGFNRGTKVLEIGCSGGPLISLLQKNDFPDITGIDVSEEAIEACRGRNLDNVHVMDGANTSFLDDEFEFIIALDVLEHIEDDASALREWRRILKPGGRLLVFVPALQFLWSEHDLVNKHFRRYSRKRLRKILQEAGFSVERSSYWNLLAFFPVTLVRIFQKLRHKKTMGTDQLYIFSPAINRFFIGILKVENRALKRITFPFGVSVFALCANGE